MKGLRIDLVDCSSLDICRKLWAALDGYRDLLPRSRDAQILIKPNLNSHMNALTGNTTDLRVLSFLVKYLKEHGFEKIIIGDGTNSGFYRNRIEVISRLKVDELARYYGIQARDLNYSKTCQIELSDGRRAEVARECIESDFLINVPKLKTHFEMGMSVCLKNLIGCMAGQENKKAIHQNLAANILRINDQIRPNLQIVDGLIAMEGLGPTRGTPVRLNVLVLGTDPYLLDLLCARLAGFDYRRVHTLRLAEERGKLTAEHFSYVSGIDIAGVRKDFLPPRPGVLARLIHSPGRQRYFLAIRNTPLFTYLAGTDWFGGLLFKTGLRQDVFVQEEMDWHGLTLDAQRCDGCGICRSYCPAELPLPHYLEEGGKDCMGCLYCYMICPREAIRFNGSLGFFREQSRQYAQMVRGLHGKSGGAGS